jgi:hypothetical protein
VIAQHCHASALANGELMTDIEPRFFDTEYKIFAHLEWEAIRMIVFNGSHMNIADAYPKFEQRQFYWIDPFNDKASEEHHAIKRKIQKREYSSLEDFYLALKPLLKPQKKGKALKDAKKRTAQAAYQLEKLGEDFIHNPELFKEARKVAKYIADKGKSEEVFTDQLTQLLVGHNVDEFTDGQIKTIWTFLDKQVEKHLNLDRVEAAILDEDNKNLYFMWGKIKREYPKGDTFTWPSAKAAKVCHCSKQDIKPIMKKLEKLGAITLIQAGKAGKNSSRAALYRREV